MLGALKGASAIGANHQEAALPSACFMQSCRQQMCAGPRNASHHMPSGGWPALLKPLDGCLTLSWGNHACTVAGVPHGDFLCGGPMVCCLSCTVAVKVPEFVAPLSAGHRVYLPFV